MLTRVMRLNFLVKGENKISEIPIIKIRPNKAQPRKVFNEDELSALSRSIAENGILQPLTVRKASQSEFELIAGERRLRAAILAGMKRVPCIIVKCTDKESAVYALLENLQRADLGIFEEARGISRTQSTIANKLRLLKLSGEEQEWIENAGLTERHARALLRIDDEDIRREVLSKIISDNLNVSQTEALVGIYKHNNPKTEKNRGRSKAVIKDIRIFLNSINRAIDTMRLSGIDAQSVKTDSENFIEYTIRIPKSQLNKTEKSA